MSLFGRDMFPDLLKVIKDLPVTGEQIFYLLVIILVLGAGLGYVYIQRIYPCEITGVSMKGTKNVKAKSGDVAVEDFGDGPSKTKGIDLENAHDGDLQTGNVSALRSRGPSNIQEQRKFL